MEEIRVSASEFRVHLKDLANQVAMGDAAVIVSRHGLALGAWVNLEEYEAFRRFQEKQRGKTRAVEVPREHPDNLPVEEVERVYHATAMATDDWTLRWRSKAWISVHARTGRRLSDPPC